MTESTVTAQQARQDLYRVIRKEDSFEEKAREALELGRQYLEVDNGHLTRIDQETDHWEAMVSTDPEDGSIPSGLELDLETTYCRRTLESDSQITLHDAPNQGWADDPAFETHEFHCYHGTTLTLSGELYGTICFVAEDPRNTEFSDGETMFAELIARLLERELERKRHESELARQANLATVLNRVLRHNLRNDMSVIRGFTQLMAEKLEDDNAGETALDTIDELLALTEKARDLDRIVAADFDQKSVEIVPFIEDISETVTREYPSATISVEYDEKFTAAVLPSFEQAITELVENAAKHGGETPTVTVAVENDSNAVIIRITDGGPGLADHEADVLKTGTETPLTHGSGLGLWITHWIVTSHDGSIDASVSEDGTTMTITIPRKPDTNVHEQITKLTRARDQYQAGFEEAYEAMVVLNDDTRIVDANPEAGRIFGRDTQELLGRALPEFFPDEFDFETVWRELQAGGSKHDTTRVVDADGTERHVEYSATANIVQGRHLIVSRDITEREERERELRRVYELLDHAERIAEVGGWEIDLDTGDVFWTEYAFELMGVDEDEEPPLEDVLEVYHEEDRPIIETAFETALDSGESFDVEVRFRRPDGELRWLRIQGTPVIDDEAVVALRGAAQDITEQKERTNRLQKKTTKLEALFEKSPDMINILDSDGIILDVNRRFCEELGYDKADVVGTPIWEIDQLFDADDVTTLLSELAADERHKFEGEYERNDGSTVSVEVHLLPLDLNGENRYLAESRDLTGRKDSRT